ncbi:MAG: UTP--glucose-1-phosphate uridylyltransferase GalU [Acidobacteriota bacterium]
MPIRKAVFPAAGLGTRFLPATKAQPKEMLPLVDKPAIQYVIEEAVASGIEDILLVTARGKGSIEDHFDASWELERLLERRGEHEALALVQGIAGMVRLASIRQKEALGLGHAILVARQWVGDENFAVFLGDDLIDADVPAMRQMMDASIEEDAAVVALEEVDKGRTKDYGIVSGKPVGDRLFKLDGMVEKPDPARAPSNLAIIGRYILPPAIFDHLEKTAPDRRGEIQLTDALRAMLAERPIYGYRFAGSRHDTGNKLGFLKATVQYALRHPDLAEQFRAYLRDLDLDRIGP